MALKNKFSNACFKRPDANRIETQFQTLLAERNQAVAKFRTRNRSIPTESVQISIAGFKNLPQELRVPQFKIEVSVK